MLLKAFLRVLENLAPLALQESYDNSGIQVGSLNQKVSRGLLCLDLTPAVLEEAISKQCDLVVCHHPMIFKGITKITGSSIAEKLIITAIKNDIAIVALHTNLDNVYEGVNQELGKRIGLKNLRILQPAKHLLKKLVTFCPTEHAEKVRSAVFAAGAGQIGNYDACSFNLEGKGSFRAGDGANPFTGHINELHYEEEVRIETIFPAYLQMQVLQAMMSNHPYEEVAYDIYPLENAFDKVGSGMTGVLDEAMDGDTFLDHIKHALNVPVVRHSRFGGKNIKKVAICGGSGSFLLPQAINAGAEAFITADVKYHQFFDAEDKLLLVDAGHYETEQFTKELMHNMIKKKIANFALLISETKTNPVNYY